MSTQETEEKTMNPLDTPEGLEGYLDWCEWYWNSEKLRHLQEETEALLHQEEDYDIH